jgi:putative PIN family toxin of toxin-antitoxin system
MRLVLDTSVLVPAFRSRSGASFHLLGLLDQDRYSLVATSSLFLEYESVLKRPEQCEVHGLSMAQLDAALDELAAHVHEVRIAFNWRPQLRDPGDEMVLATAINGFADAIVTHNLRDFYPAAGTFGITVLTPSRMRKERSSHGGRD